MAEILAYNPMFGNNAVQPATYVGSRIPEHVNNDESLGGALAGGGLFMGGIYAAPKLRHPVDNWKAIGETSKTLQDAFGSKDTLKAFYDHAKGDFKYLSQMEKMKILGNMYNYERLLARVPDAETKRAIEKMYKSYVDAVQSGNAKAVAECGAKIETVINRARDKNWFQRLFMGKQTTNVKEATKDISKIGKAAGAKAAQTIEAAKAAESASTLGKAAHWAKGSFKAAGGGFMAAFEGIFETVDEIIPAWQMGGAEAGMKQVGKSALTVAGSVAGWCVGMKAGAAVGAAVGSIIPGAGTAVGAIVGGIIGIAGGLAGSWLGRKTAKAVTGKTEREKLKEQQAINRKEATTLNFETNQLPVESINNSTKQSWTLDLDATNPFKYGNNINTYTLPNSNSMQYNMTNPFETQLSYGNQAILDEAFNRPMYC